MDECDLWFDNAMLDSYTISMALHDFLDVIATSWRYCPGGPQGWPYYDLSHPG